MEMEADFPLKISRSLRKSISMRIDRDGTVLVSAPLYMSSKQVDEFISGHRRWIENNRKRILERKSRPDFYSRLPLDTPGRMKEAAQRLMNIVLPMVERHAEIMGARPSKVTFRASRTRWGSCNNRLRTLNFSLYLLLLPQECIEEVVVHELSHLIEPNHGPRFYALMDKYWPQWRHTRQIARKIVRDGRI